VPFEEGLLVRVCEGFKEALGFTEAEGEFVKTEEEGVRESVGLAEEDLDTLGQAEEHGEGLALEGETVGE